jgi:hypothetical protein
VTSSREAVAALQTNRQARAALGIAADNLRKGYEVIKTIAPSTWDFELEDIGDSQVRQQATDLLDRTNAYAGGIYATIPDDDGELPDATRTRVGVALDQAESNLRLLTTAADQLIQPFMQDLEDLVAAIGTATLEATRFVADKAKLIVGTIVPTWVWYALAGALCVGVGVYAWRIAK